jgi:hypothetical protein
VTLAELEIWHSRPIAPTRRVAIGEHDLPCDPPPGYGGILLAGIVASCITGLDPDNHPDLLRLTHQLEDGGRVPQPRLRHRFQQDRIGLNRTRHVLRAHGDQVEFDLEVDRATPEQMVLGAVYTAGTLPPGTRHRVMRSLRTAMQWEGTLGPDFIARVTGFGTSHDLGAAAYRNPMLWALGILGLEVPAGVVGPANGGANGSAHRARGRNGNGHGRADRSDGPDRGARSDGPNRPDRKVVQRRFRELLREAHPDHGGATDDAAKRIAELTEARRILLGA